jgi:hypothetical protein
MPVGPIVLGLFLFLVVGSGNRIKSVNGYSFVLSVECFN